MYQSQALIDVASERHRQQTASAGDANNPSGWSTEHDDAKNTDYELAKAASVYVRGAALHPQARSYLVSRAHPAAPWKPAPWVEDWPQSWDLSWYKPTTRRRDLVKAAALIIAEIERLDRAEACETASSSPCSEPKE